MLDGQECSRIYGLSGVLGIFASTVDDECLLVEFLCLPFIFISKLLSLDAILLLIEFHCGQVVSLSFSQPYIFMFLENKFRNNLAIIFGL